MRRGRAAQRAGLTARALRYYEAVGLVVPARQSNGYRDYQPQDVRLLREVKCLTELGLSVEQTRPFLTCLSTGHEQVDECPASLASYRAAIAELDARIAEMTIRRDALATRLASASDRALCGQISTEQDTAMNDLTRLPDDLPIPTDDGAADHLAGLTLPSLALDSTAGGTVVLDQLAAGRSVLYFYPLTGRPGVDLPEGWDSIPGARGCTAEACDFRDHHAELHDAGVTAVYGVSSQTTAYQREVADRLRLPFAMLSDPNLSVAGALGLPTFTTGEQQLYTRLTLVLNHLRIEHVFYPVFPPNEHARHVLDWLRAHPIATQQ